MCLQATTRIAGPGESDIRPGEEGFVCWNGKQQKEECEFPSCVPLCESIVPGFRLKLIKRRYAPSRERQCHRTFLGDHQHPAKKRQNGQQSKLGSTSINRMGEKRLGSKSRSSWRPCESE